MRPTTPADLHVAWGSRPAWMPMRISSRRPAWHRRANARRDSGRSRPPRLEQAGLLRRAGHRAREVAHLPADVGRAFGADLGGPHQPPVGTIADLSVTEVAGHGLAGADRRRDAE